MTIHSTGTDMKVASKFSSELAARSQTPRPQEEIHWHGTLQNPWYSSLPELTPQTQLCDHAQAKDAYSHLD